ncbi:siroheme synthase (precorrin-2 oxidase/ferrochelatase) [Salinibacter ruber]|nr:siroheme synthase (precorrin-2 oxidase/ferrochelatase) [Salinibacter ruber]
MHELLPKAKLIYLVRDPVERAVSHYVHNWAHRRWSKSIGETVLPVEESWPLTVSRYHMQLSQYLEYYSMREVLVIQSERLRRRPGDIMEEVFRFIGVDPTVARKEGAFEEEHHVSTEKIRKNGLAAFFTDPALGRAVKNAGKQLLPQRTIEWAKDALWKDVEKPTLSDDIRSRVEDYLREDMDQLRALTGKEFEGWSV